MEQEQNRPKSFKQEMKTLDEVARHFPRASGGVGIDRTTLYTYLKRGVVNVEWEYYPALNRILIYIPREWQLKDAKTWCLDKVHKRGKRGRPSNKSRIGLE